MTNNISINDIIIIDSVKSWLKSIKERKHQRTVRKYTQKEKYNIEEAYQLLISVLVDKTDEQNSFIPNITILSDYARSSETIDTHLSIDLGNTRTIGLFVEKDPNTAKYKLGNAAPLQIINYDFRIFCTVTFIIVVKN